MKRFDCLVVAIAGVLSALPSGALGTTPTFYILQKDTRFIQTGASTITSDGFDLVGKASPNDGVGPIAFDGGTLSFPAASPLTTAPLSPAGVSLQYASGKVAQATFQADYPNGIYTFHVTSSANMSLSQTEAVNSTIITAPATVPMLSAASFNALQGMDPTKPFTVSFNSFADPNPTALIFFAVQGPAGTLIFDGLQPNVTQDTIAAGTLSPGTQYSWFLFFTNAGITADNNGEVLLENRTTGSFSTVPEPAVALPVALLAIAMLLSRRATPRTASA